MPFVALGTTITAPSGATQGSVLYKGALRWDALGPGTAGYFLQTQGGGADPVWAAAGGGGAIPSGSGIAEVSSGAWVSTARSLATVLGDILTTRGDVFTRGGSGVTRLAVGGAGAFLRTNGTDPSWSTLTLPNAAATGSLLYASATNTGAALGIGTTGQVLWVSGGLPAWRTLLLSDVGAPTADFAMGSHKLTGLPAGSAPGDSVRWEQSPAGILTTVGDLLVEGTGPAPTRLAAAAAGKLLRATGAGALPAYSTLTVPDTIASGSMLRASAANVVSEIVYLGTSVQQFGTVGDATWTGWTLTNVGGSPSSTVTVASSKLHFVTTGSVGSGASASLSITQDQYMAGVRMRFRIATFSPASASTSIFIYGIVGPLAAGVTGARELTATNISATKSNANVFDNSGAGWIEAQFVDGVCAMYYGTGTTTTPPTSWKLFRAGPRASPATDGDTLRTDIQFLTQQSVAGTSTFDIDHVTIAPYGYGA